MRLKDIIRATKQNVDIGKEWKSGPSPKTVWPTGKGRAFKVPGTYRWRLATFDALGREFKILVIVNYGLPKYIAHLGMVDGDRMRMLAALSYEATHPGWHLHSCCGNSSVLTVPSAKIGFRACGFGRIPPPRQPHRRMNFGIKESNAMRKALDFFYVPHDEPPDTDDMFDAEI